MTPKEREYLEDTVSILVNYDGESTDIGLKGLIDEARERITEELNGKVDDK